MNCLISTEEQLPCPVYSSKHPGPPATFHTRPFACLVVRLAHEKRDVFADRGA